ncbi:MAG: HD domain-containing protein [Deltaproteobacteria bacterium]|nr:HD domain-containing protein [Deltaproteobacteria bacterium]
MDIKVNPSYDQLLADYLETGQETALYQVAQFGKQLMEQGVGPESIVEMHLQAVKKINDHGKVYPQEVIDESFAFLMEGIMAYGLAFREHLSSKTEGYLAEIRELNQRLSQKLVEMTALHETVEMAGSSLELEEVLAFVLENAARTLKAENGSLMLLDPEAEVLTIKKAYALGEDIISKTRIRMGEGIAGLVAQSGEPLLMHGQEKGGKKYKGVHSVCTPLKTQKGILGVVNLNRGIGQEAFSEEDLRLLITITREAATAIGNSNLYRDLRDSYLSTIRALAAALEAKDPYTRGHSDAVARYAAALAGRLGLSRQEIETIEVAAILHDIGKIGIHEEILNKPDKLNDDEWQQVRQHPECSLKILDNINFPWDIKPLIYSHHERYDGKGYPDGLKGEEIPLGARIIAVADVYDAMTSDRAYRKAMKKKAAMEEIQRLAGAQLDPGIVQVFIDILRSEGKRKV